MPGMTNQELNNYENKNNDQRLTCHFRKRSKHCRCRQADHSLPSQRCSEKWNGHQLKVLNSLIRKAPSTVIKFMQW